MTSRNTRRVSNKCVRTFWDGNYAWSLTKQWSPTSCSLVSGWGVESSSDTIVSERGNKTKPWETRPNISPILILRSLPSTSAHFTALLVSLLELFCRFWTNLAMPSVMTTTVFPFLSVLAFNELIMINWQRKIGRWIKSCWSYTNKLF